VKINNEITKSEKITAKAAWQAKMAKWQWRNNGAMWRGAKENKAKLKIGETISANGIIWQLSDESENQRK